MKASGNMHGQLRVVQRWPFYLLPLIAALVVVEFFSGRSAGMAALIFLLLYLIFSLVWLFYWNNRITREIVEFASNFDRTQKAQMEELALPYALMSVTGEFVWMNKAFRAITEDKHYQKHICSIFPEVAERLPGPGESRSETLSFQDVAYQVDMKYLEAERPFISICMYDVTEHLEALTEIEDRKIVLGLIYVDNYEEVMKSTESVRQSLLAALIERKLNKYFSAYGGIVRKLDKDKFFFILTKKDLIRIQENRFSLLEDVKTLNIGNETAVTLSIGTGVDGDTIAANSEYARMAIDLCLGRGGDQAIVRTPEGSKFYGGKTQQQENNTRVKARIKAQALRELLVTKDQILVMGHKLSDIDSVGAAIGIYRAAKSLDKKTHIVLQDVTSSVRPLLQRFNGNPDYPEDLIVNRERALELLDDNTTVIMVDVNRSSYTECPELLNRAKSIVVLDHHRQCNEMVKNPTLSYIEPYASSACEMVAEILQYFADNLKLRPIEAEAIYAGIVIDTNNFMNKTGVRTFEAAAYLRRCGADMTRVRKMFRERMEDYRAKAETVSSVELFEGCFAFGVCPSKGIESPMIIGAQAANDLLDVIGVKASIIFTEYQDQIYISARSIDEVNVQLIMERLGGGGHLSTAGAQLRGCSVEDAKSLVKETIHQMMEEGAI